MFSFYFRAWFVFVAQLILFARNLYLTGFYVLRAYFFPVNSLCSPFMFFIVALALALRPTNFSFSFNLSLTNSANYFVFFLSQPLHPNFFVPLLLQPFCHQQLSCAQPFPTQFNKFTFNNPQQLHPNIFTFYLLSTDFLPYFTLPAIFWIRLFVFFYCKVFGGSSVEARLFRVLGIVCATFFTHCI